MTPKDEGWESGSEMLYESIIETKHHREEPTNASKTDISDT